MNATVHRCMSDETCPRERLSTYCSDIIPSYITAETTMAKVCSSPCRCLIVVNLAPKRPLSALKIGQKKCRVCECRVY